MPDSSTTAVYGLSMALWVLSACVLALAVVQCFVLWHLARLLKGAAFGEWWQKWKETRQGGKKGQDFA